MKNRKEFIDCVYNANKDGLLYPKFLFFKEYNECNMLEIIPLFKILGESNNLSNGDCGCILIDYENKKNETFEKYELSVCLLMISLIVNSKFQKSDTKFETHLNKCYKQEKYYQPSIKNLFVSLGSVYPNALRRFYSFAKNVIGHYGPCDMYQLFDDLLDWEIDTEIAERWANEIVFGGKGGHGYAK